MILIVTSKNDSHADAAIKLLVSRGKAVLRLNTEDFLSGYTCDIAADNEGSWSGDITDRLGRVLSLNALRVAWFRKPTHVSANPFRHLDLGTANFVVSEIKSTLEAIYSATGAHWVNDPFHANRAKVKLQQLQLASSLGMKIPRSLITTRPESAREFVRSCGADGAVVKAVYTSNVAINGVNQGILTRRLTFETFAPYADAIGSCPTMLQEYCDKAFELRVTVVGHHVVAVRIDSQLHSETSVDWRADTSRNPHSLYSLPTEVECFCRDFITRQNLVYGAMDLIVTPTGEYVFLENNPYGNYLWLDLAVDAGITRRMVETLCQT